MARTSQVAAGKLIANELHTSDIYESFPTYNMKTVSITIIKYQAIPVSQSISISAILIHPSIHDTHECMWVHILIISMHLHWYLYKHNVCNIYKTCMHLHWYLYRLHELPYRGTQKRLLGLVVTPCNFVCAEGSRKLKLKHVKYISSSSVRRL